MAIIEIDGDLFDDETGEYAGPAGGGYLPAVLQTEDDLLKFMRILLDAETRVLAEEAKYKTMLSNVEKMVKRHKSKVNYLRTMYEGQASNVAATLLPRDKSGNLKTKTYLCPFGKVSERDTQPSVKVANPDAAIQYLKRECPAAIKVQESVLVSAIPADLKKVLIDDSVMAEGLGFNVSPGGKSVTIKTVVEAKDEA
jgi:phage host-nuclease inhibitor protein Gam